MNIDKETGYVLILENTKLSKGYKSQDVDKIGFVFDNVFDMGNGWVHKSLNCLTTSDGEFSVTFTFNNDALETIKISKNVDDFSKNDIDKVFHNNNVFISSKLGHPSKSTDRVLEYLYDWGGVYSEKDVRSNSAYILIRWI